MREGYFKYLTMFGSHTNFSFVNELAEGFDSYDVYTPISCSYTCRFKPTGSYSNNPVAFATPKHAKQLASGTGFDLIAYRYP